MRKIPILLLLILFMLMMSVIVGAEDMSAVRPYVEFNDVKEKDWYYDYVKLCYQAGVMSGTNEHNFNPLDNLTLNDAIVLTSHLYQIYNPNSKILTTDGDWFKPYYQYALQNNLILKDEYVDKSVINKEQFVIIVSRALHSESLVKINDLNSIPGYLSKDAYEQVLTLYRAGILAGSDVYGTFTAYAPITRAEVAVILSRIIYPNMRSLESFDLQISPLSQKIDITLDSLTIIDFDDTYIYAKNQKSGEFSVFDLAGKQVIPWQKNTINKISDEVFRIGSVEGSTYFYMNKEGVRLNDLTYEFATDFDEGFAIVIDKVGDPYVINKKGEAVQTISEEYFGLKLSGGYVYLADQGAVRLMKIQTGEVIKLPYYEITSFTNGVARARYFDGEQSISNLIDRSLTPLWTAKYDYVRWGINYFPVMLDFNKPLYGVANRTGKLVMPVEFTEVLTNQNDVALFFRNNDVSLRQMNNGKIILGLSNKEDIKYSLYDNYLVKTTTDSSVNLGRHNQESDTVQNIIINFSGCEILKIEVKNGTGMWFGRKGLIYSEGASLFYMNLE